MADVTAPETAVFALSEGIARGKTLFDTGAERFEGRSEENSYAGWRFHCYSWAVTAAIGRAARSFGLEVLGPSLFGGALTMVALFMPLRTAARRA